MAAARRYPGLSHTVTVRGDRVEVSVSAPLDLPLVPPGWDGEARVTGGSAAIVQVAP